MQSSTLVDKMEAMANQIPPKLHKKMPAEACRAMKKARLRQPMTDVEQHVMCVVWMKCV